MFTLPSHFSFQLSSLWLILTPKAVDAFHPTDQVDLLDPVVSRTLSTIPRKAGTIWGQDAIAGTTLLHLEPLLSQAG